MHGIEPIYKVLQIAPSGCRRSVAWRSDTVRVSICAQRDATLVPQIEGVWQANLQVYGVDNIWMQMRRESIAVARCTVERLMRHLGLCGVVRGKLLRTTVSDCKTACPLDRTNWKFRADRPNQLWVSTWQRWLYVAFVHRRLRQAHRRLTDEWLNALEKAFDAT